jgi:FAD/FMN-containing dehydrogenase
MSEEWVNWSGSLRFTPGRLVAPRDEEAVVRLVREAAREGRKLRVVGAGHSSVPLVETTDVLMSLRAQKRVLMIDRDANRATLECGFTVAEAGRALREAGLSMHNTGDVDVQLVAGAISTGTHGTGARLPNLSWMLHGVRLVNGLGEVIDTDRERDPEFMRAAAVSLGTLGVFTAITLRLEPAFRLERREYFVPLRACLALWDDLRRENRNFDFYWYPRSPLRAESRRRAPMDRACKRLASIPRRSRWVCPTAWCSSRTCRWPFRCNASMHRRRGSRSSC